MKIKDELTNAGNIVDFIEYDGGHMGVLFPEDKSLIDDVLNIILSVE